MRFTATPGVTASSAHMSRAFGSDCSCSSLKFCCVARGGGVDDRRFAGDRDRLLQRRDGELDVELSR